MKLSIVIICWNDRNVILNCLQSIVDETRSLAFEVIVSDNGSTDDSIRCIRERFPSVKVVENRANLGFSRGNNAGIQVAEGDYVLILNPDTIIHARALERLVTYADCHPEAGGFGCRVLNPDGSFQHPARPIPTIRSYLVAALYVRFLGRLSSYFDSDVYPGWKGETERRVGFQSGCCVMFRRELLSQIGGFDDRFFYHYEENDLCKRFWNHGYPILFYPGAEITHLGGQSVGRFPIRFALETYRGSYRYFYKHYGMNKAIALRKVWLLNLIIRYCGYSAWKLFKPAEALENRLKMYRVAIAWNWRLDPVRFIEKGEEPPSNYEPLAPPPDMITTERGVRHSVA